MGCGRSGIPAEPEGNRTGRKVFCVKFQREMPGLDEPPFDNEMGQRIFETVSKEAWKLWVEQMKMIMNEYRLNLSSPDAQKFLMNQMEQYFFGEGSASRLDICLRKARTKTGATGNSVAISNRRPACALPAGPAPPARASPLARK